MTKLAIQWGALLLLCAGTGTQAATLTVTTNNDEANCRNVAGCPAGMASLSFPNSTGCSLREALQDIADVGNAQPLSFPECGAPTAGGPNTINLSGRSIVIYSSVKDPSDSTGVAMINNGSLPYIGNKATFGSLTITNGALSCMYDPNVVPVIGGNSMLHETDGADLSITGTQFQNCTAAADGVAIVNSGSGDLNLAGVTFGSIVPGNGIRAVNQGNGGCISHGSGNLSITGGSFTACEVDNGTPGAGAGNGGAIYIGSVGSQQKVAISGVTFQANIAGNNGGAIYLSNTDAVAINTSQFLANVANGNTFSSGNAELGGGAIYATGTAANGNMSGGGINASAFLIFQTLFAGNLAPKGTGGAILLTGSGKLTDGVAGFTLNGTTIAQGQIPGGIIASNFSGNLASGTWDTSSSLLDPRAGSGGAVYASGTLTVLSSSFVGGNSSQNSSGGAIAYHDASNSFPPLNVANTTFNGNSAAINGGAIANLKDKNTSQSGQMVLINDTISGNTTSLAGGGGGLFTSNTTASDVQISNTIFDGGGSSGNCLGVFTDVVGNLQFNPAAGCMSIANTGDPKLQSAGLFGGAPNLLVFVMKLNSGSAASGTADPVKCTGSPIFNLDETVGSRPAGKPNCDVGAFESAIVPDLTITKSHIDPFKQGDVGKTYTITVTNSGNDSTAGTVTLTENLPAGLTATAISGTGWNGCTATPVVGPNPLTCSRNDPLASGAAYATITVTVDVAANAAVQVTNNATVAGGSESATGNDSVNDLTNVQTSTPVHLQSFEVD